MPRIASIGLLLALCGCEGLSQTFLAGREGPGSAIDPADVAGPGSTPSNGPGQISPVDDDQPLGPLDPGSAPLRRLTNQQLENTLRMLVPDALVAAPVDYQGLLARESTTNDYNNQAITQAVDLTTLERLRQVALALSSQLPSASSSALASQLYGCQPTGANDSGCMTTFVERFGERALRRPLTSTERGELVGLGSQIATRDGSFAAGARTVVEALVQSPSFLYRYEEAGGAGERADLTKLDDYAIASRLSFLLVNRGPDATALLKAKAGELQTADQVLAEADRLLALPESKPAIREFHRQWLKLEKLDRVSKNATLYPTFNPALVASMKEETRRVLEDFAWGKRNFLELFDADRTYVDGNLAALYGVAPPSPTSSFVSVALPAHRRGLIGHAGVLAANAHSENSSPTQRGLLVRNRLFCTEVVVPEGIDTTPKPPDPNQGPMTEREIAEMHSSDPACAGCHKLFDGVGFGLESFDSIGAHRTLDHGKPVDDRGTLVTTKVQYDFRGVSELGPLLRAAPEVRRCLVRNWLQWASGRPLEGTDDTTVSFVERHFKSNGHEFLALVRGYVASDAFRYRR